MPTEVAIGVLVESGEGGDGGPRILITRRPEGRVLSGLWELPGGKVMAGETARQCLEREFKEELGVQVCIGQALSPVEYRYEHDHVLLRPFYCRLVAGRPTCRQVASWKWVDLDQLRGIDFPPANESITAQIIADLGPSGAGDDGCDKTQDLE